MAVAYELTSTANPRLLADRRTGHERAGHGHLEPVGPGTGAPTGPRPGTIRPRPATEHAAHGAEHCAAHSKGLDPEHGPARGSTGGDPDPAELDSGTQGTTPMSHALAPSIPAAALNAK
jgi:hypothetical protein